MANSLTRAYARGVAERLLQEDGVKVASLEHAARIADAVGDRIDYPIWEKAATAELVQEIANEILKLAAEEPRLITSKPGQENTLEAAAAGAGGMAAMENAERPTGEHLVGPGNTTLDTSPGEVGKVSKKDKAPDESAPNSANEDAKTAALRSLLRKLSSDALVTGDRPDQKNTLENAAADTGGMAAMEASARPTGQHLVGVGNTQMPIPAAGVVGQEEILPAGEMGSPALPQPVNSLTEESNKSASFEENFKKVATQILPLLPSALPESEKIAAVRTCMGLSSVERLQYLTKLSEEMSDSEKKDEKKCEDCGKAPCECDKGEKDLPPGLEALTEDEKTAAVGLLSRLVALSEN